jgi:hypothetical protein
VEQPATKPIESDDIKTRNAADAGFNPDSAVGINAKSEEQTLRSEANGSLPLSEHRSSLFDDVVRPEQLTVEEGEHDFETARLGVFTASD